MSLGYPAWLWLWIVVPVLAIAAVLAGRFAKRPWEEFAAERLRGKLIKREHPLPRWLSLSFLLAGIIALIFTMARPQGDAGTKTETTTGRNVMIALDLSRSMRVQDVKPDRLAQAKIVIYELLEKLENDRIGLIGFAGSPFLSAPLTIDHAAVRETVEQMDETWMPLGGTDFPAALQLAIATLKETGQKNNVLVLISDGEDHSEDLDPILAEAERAGVTVFAIGVGTEDGGFVPHSDFTDGYLTDRGGDRILSRLESDMLRKVAEETGGRYVIAGTGADIPAMVEVTIQGMDAFEVEGGETRIVIEFFQWALLPAILFLMASIVSGTRWRGMARVGTAAMFFSMVQSGFGTSLSEARRAFDEGDFGEARDAYRSLAEENPDSDRGARYRLAEGLAAYEAQDFRGARTAYSAALLADDSRVVGRAHEGLGNTLFQLGWMGLAGSRYPAGEKVPNMEVFDKLVRDQLERMSEAVVPQSGDSTEFSRLEAVILNWTDAARHYQSALKRNPGDKASQENRELTVRYLKRLQEILNEEKKKAEEEMPQQGEGQQSQPQEGQEEGESEPGENPGEGEEESDQGKGGEEEQEQGPGDKEAEKQEEGPDGEKPDDKEGEEGENPNETPEERARRILDENSDLQRGPLNPGRREFRDPAKDY